MSAARKNNIFEVLEEFDTPAPISPPRPRVAVRLKDLSPGRIYYLTSTADDEDYHTVCGCLVCVRSLINPTVWIPPSSV